MALMLHSADSAGGYVKAWVEAFEAELPDLEVRTWPEVGDVGEIAYALVWRPKPGDLKRYPNLEAIFSMGAGVEHILSDPQLPAGVPVVRLVDPVLTSQMSEYVALAVLGHHRRALDYAALQAERRWRPLRASDTPGTTVGFLGLGVMAQASARVLLGLGFRIVGWSRTAKDLPDIACFHGADQLETMLAETDILVSLLPSTPETEGLLDARAIRALPRGASIINAGRGVHVVDTDLLAALDSGHVSGATLDVFADEPLPGDHPYWSHPRVVLTPHVASETVPRSAAKSVAENIRRLRTGAPLEDVIDPARGY